MRSYKASVVLLVFVYPLAAGALEPCNNDIACKLYVTEQLCLAHHFEKSWCREYSILHAEYVHLVSTLKACSTDSECELAEDRLCTMAPSTCKGEL